MVALLRRLCFTRLRSSQRHGGFWQSRPRPLLRNRFSTFASHAFDESVVEPLYPMPDLSLANETTVHPNHNDDIYFSSNYNINCNNNGNTFCPVLAADLSKMIQNQCFEGKYRDIIGSIVARPDVLVAAYNNLRLTPDVSASGLNNQLACEGIDSDWFNNLVDELYNGIFDVRLNCLEMLVPTGTKRRSFRLVPSLRLKVVQEAIKMILEEIYEGRFSKICHGHRPGKGKHTALRDIKLKWTTATWWICIDLHKQFEVANFNILVSLLERTIEDRKLVHLLLEMFRAGILQLDLGGLCRGFSDENILSPMLVNVYLDRLDQEIKRICEKVQLLNQHAGPNNWDSVDGKRQGQPVMKLFACRYVDEMILGLAGPKSLAISVRNDIVRFVHIDMHLEVGRSIIKERAINVALFLGMELHFVPTSEVPGYFTHKAIASVRKVQLRMTVLASQQKLLWENFLRKLAGRMLIQVLENAKGYKISMLEVEDRVRKLFKDVSRDISEKFFASHDREDADEILHSKSAYGERFLGPWIQENLPQDLVQAHDELQEKIGSYLSDKTTTADEDFSDLTLIPSDKDEAYSMYSQVQRDEDRLESWSSSSVQDLRLLIYAPTNNILRMLRVRGLVDNRGIPRHVGALISQEDIAILQWFGAVSLGLLNYYRCCDNLVQVKRIVNYHVRRSCLYTLAAKHKSTARNILKEYTPELKVRGLDDRLSCYFPTEGQTRCMGRIFLCDPDHIDSILFTLVVKMSSKIFCPQKCSIIGCCDSNVLLYAMRIFQLKDLAMAGEYKRRHANSFIAPHSALHLKGLPLCRGHYLDMSSGRVCLKNLRVDLLVPVKIKE